MTERLLLADSGFFSPSIAGFKLTSDRQQKHRVHLRHVAVKGNVPARTSANHKLALASDGGTNYLRIGLQDVQSVDDVAVSRCCVFEVMLGKVVEGAIKVMADLSGQLDPGHR